MAKILKRGEHIMGLDIGGTKVLAMVLDYNFKCKGRSKKRMRSEKGDEPAEQRVLKAIQEALEDAKVDSVVGIGAGSPGPLDPETGVIIDTPNLAWKNFPLAKTIRDAFKTPCKVDNDVNMGTYGEWKFGDIKDCRNVLGIFPGTGIGGGLIINGKLHHGFTGAAGEVGHMTIDMDGPFCGCGKRGCLEAVASRTAIASEVAALAARGDAPYVFKTCGTDLAAIRSSVLAKAIESGEKMVEEVVRRAAFFLGVGVANCINVISPQAVVLGGGLVEAMQDLYMEEVKRAVKAHAMPFLRKNVKLVPAKLGDDAVAMGAAMMMYETLEA